MDETAEHKDVVLEEPKNETAAADNDELKVEVAEEAPIKAEAPKKEEIAPEEGIQELKKKLEMEMRARQEAERRAHESAQQAKKASSETKDANYQLVVNAIETVKGRSEALKKAYAEAMNVGDFEKAATIQEAIAINAGQLSELNRGKDAMKEQLKAQENGGASTQTPPPRGEIVDQLAASVSPRSAAWLNSQRENIRSERDVRKMFRAHEDAIDDGIEPDTDEYFNFIEQRMGINKPPESPMSEAAAPAPAPAPRRSAPPPSAPVSRGNQRPNVVRLTRDQVEMAKMMGMSEADYAKNMVALQREGKLTH